MLKFNIKAKILRLTLATGALTVLALGTSSYLNLNTVSKQLLEWESQASSSASEMLEHLSVDQSMYSLELIADNMASHFSGRLVGRINDVQLMAEKLTHISRHPELYKPRKLPELTKDIISTGQPYVNLGFLRGQPRDPELQNRMEILSNIADIMFSLKDFYSISSASLYAISEDGYSINLELSDHFVENIEVQVEQEELSSLYDLRMWDAYKLAKSSMKPVISMYSDQGWNGRIFSIVVPYSDQHGFAGIAGLDLTIAQLFENLNINRFMSGFDYFVLDPHGHILFSSRKTGMLIEKGYITSQLQQQSRSLYEAVQDMMRGAKRTVMVEVDGDSYYMSYAPIQECQWSFAVIEKTSSTTGQVTFTKKRLSSSLQTLRTELEHGLTVVYYVLGVLLCVLLIVIIWVSVKQAERFTRPILKLVVMVAEISQGHLERRIDIRTGDEIEELASSFNEMTTDLKHHMEQTQRVTAEKERIDTELNVATKIQQSMLPQKFPSQNEGYDLYAISIPAKEMGGDFYDFYLLDPEHLVVTIADVSGKGVPAALFMVISKTILKNNTLLMKPETRLCETVDRTNLQLYQENHEDMFVTVFIGILNLKNGQFTYVSAGHNPPLLSRAGTDKYCYLESEEHRPMLGVLDDISYVQQTITLQKGDRLFLYTDGVTEAMNERGEQFGTERLAEVLSVGPEIGLREQSEEVLGSVRLFAGQAEQSDDITMLSLRYQKAP